MSGKSGALLNYTTSIDAAKTAMEIIHILVKHGVDRIQVLPDSNGRISQIEFGIGVGRGMDFRLPVNVKVVYEVLGEQAKKRLIPQHYAVLDQAERVAWRIIKAWIDAQIALIETKMVKMEEVFLPYLLVSRDQTLFEKMRVSKFLLPEPKASEP